MMRAGDFRNLAQADIGLLAFDRLDIDDVARRERAAAALAAVQAEAGGG